MGHLGEQRLRRLARVVRIFYHDKSYQLSRDIEALKRVIIGDI
jgi:hypothetical protein